MLAAKYDTHTLTAFKFSVYLLFLLHFRTSSITFSTSPFALEVDPLPSEGNEQLSSTAQETWLLHLGHVVNFDPTYQNFCIRIFCRLGSKSLISLNY